MCVLVTEGRFKMLNFRQAALLVTMVTMSFSCQSGADAVKKTMYDVLTSKKPLRPEFCSVTECGLHSSHNCACDRECTHYKDCCKHYKIEDPFNTPVYQLMPYMKCMKIIWTGREFIGDSYQMVGRCPESWKDERTKKKCHELENNNVLENNPFYSKSDHVSFRNMYCAVCHGITKDEVKHWDLKVRCKTFVNTKQTSLTLLIGSYVESGQCLVVYSIGQYAERQTKQRFCYMKSSNYVTQCPAVYKGHLKDLCAAYLAPVAIMYNIVHIIRIYRNEACLKCDDFGVNESFANSLSYTCVYTTRIITNFRLFLTLNFAPFFYGSDEEDPESCNDNEVFIKRLGQCVILDCPEGSTAQTGECVKYERETNSGFLNLVYYVEGNVEDEVVHQALLSIVTTFNSILPCWKFIYLSDKGKLDIKRGFQPGSDKEHCLYASITATIFDGFGYVNERIITCLQKYFRTLNHASNLSISYRDDTNNPFCNTTVMPPHLPIVTLPDYFLQNRVNCPAIEVYPDKNLTLANSPGYSDNITYYLGDIVIDADHVNETDNRYFICLSVFKQFYDNVLPDRPLEKSYWYKAIVSYTCMGVSIVSLSITLFHYCVVPNMLTTHSLILLHLVIIMLLTHTTYVLGVKSYSSSVQCWWIGVIIHCLFLSLFFAMSLSLLQITRQLRNMVNPFTKKSIMETIVKYIIPCYILVFLIIGTTLLVNKFIYPDDVWYGNGYCFITRPSTLFYSFALPVALCLVFNISIFVAMGRFLCTMSSTNEMLVNTNRNYFWLSVKLSTLTGVSWVIGFVAALTRVEILEMVFEVTSSLQGLFLGVSLLSNKLVREWYRRKFSRYLHSETDTS